AGADQYSDGHLSSAGVSHPELFRKIGYHIARQTSLNSFKPQDFSNTAWAFATAGASHPELFKKIGNHLAGLMSLNSFNPQALSNTAWSFATAGISYPELFRKIGDHVAELGCFDSFKPQELSNTVWACATIGHTDERLFSAFAPVIRSKLDECSEQDLANIAWAYSVANLPRHDLFNEGYAGALASNENEFSVEEFRQLHQWQLWQQELQSGIELPRSLRAKCRNAFTSRGFSESKLQNDVVDELRIAGLDLEEEVLLGSGYRIDALVKVGDGRKVAIEVDGPFHFIDRRPAGRTTLKHRQVATLDRIEVVSVPYWEWDELKNSEMKQHYLRKKLALSYIIQSIYGRKISSRCTAHNSGIALCDVLPALVHGTNNTRAAPRRRHRYLRPEPLEPVFGPLGRVRDGVPGQQAREQAQEQGLEATGVPQDEQGREEHARQDEAPHRQAR
ncbi:hypothetical protein THAOC_26753, partial [Thalassiosira oceanica]